MRRFKVKKRFKRKESILKNRFFWLSSFILILVFGLSYLFIFSQIFRIEEIKISNTDDFLRIKVEEVVKSEIGKNIFLVNLKKINKEILSQFPEIAQLNLKRKFPRIISIQIETREPVGIWCYQSHDKCFFIDEEGIIFKAIGEESIEGKIIILSLKEGEIFTLGEKILVPQILELILEIEKELEENLKIAIEDFTIVSEKRLNVKTKENWEIYFNLKKDIGLELTKFKVLLEKEIPPEERRNLEYIDLRFEKIFYK
jgi:cell division septal protein FtsQ